MLKCKCIVKSCMTSSCKYPVTCLQLCSRMILQHIIATKRSWFLIIQHAKAESIPRLQFSLQSPQQQQGQQAATHPLLPKSSLIWCTWSPVPKSPFTLLTGCCAMLYSLHSTHLMLMSIDVQWSTPGSRSRTPESYCPYSEGHTFRHFHHEVEATGFQSRGPVLLPSWYKSESLLPTVPK